MLVMLVEGVLVVSMRAGFGLMWGLWAGLILVCRLGLGLMWPMLMVFVMLAMLLI